MTCPSAAPESGIACTLDDTEEAHRYGHQARTADGQGTLAWGVTLDDHDRWGVTPPDELVQWAADAEAAAAAAEQDPTDEAPADDVADPLAE